MNKKQRRFVAEYAKDQNGTQAAIRAGYSQKTAGVQASKLLKIPKIQAAVEKDLQKIEQEAMVSAAWVLKSLKEVAERCLQGVPVTIKGSNGELIETGEWKFDSAGANRALELLGKTKALFTENVKLGAMSLEKLLGESNE